MLSNTLLFNPKLFTKNLNPFLKLIWSNSITVGGGGRWVKCPPDIFPQEVFWWPTGKRRQERKGKGMGRGRGRGNKENWKRKRWKIENGREKSMKISRGPFVTFWYHWFFYQEKAYFMSCWKMSSAPSKKKSDFAPSEKYSSYVTDQKLWFQLHICPLFLLKNYCGKFSAEKKNNKSCLSIHNILCDLLLTVVKF